MILSGESVERAITEGTWGCNRAVANLNFGPNSVDVTLSRYFLTPRGCESLGVVDPEKVTDLFLAVEADEIIIGSGEFILGSVNEKFDADMPIHIDGKYHLVVPMYEGRSTMARLGIQSHLSAGFGDYGFKGSFTLEIKNNSPWPIKLKEGIRIGQVYFITTDSRVATNPYRGYDQGDCRPQRPRLGEGRM